MTKKRKKHLKVTKVSGNVAINRSPLRKAIQSVNRSPKATKKIRFWANGDE